MRDRRQKVGRWGEEVAAGYLIEHGYRVIARNHRTPYGEIDIVAAKDDDIICVEVKTRTSGSLGPPEISVTPRKQEHMRAAAEHYAQQNEIEHWRIDVITVEGKPGTKTDITHFESAI